MSIRERIFKIASYIFMSLMLLLIVVSFGMPDFISSSAESSRLNAAKVGNDSVSLREVGQIRNQMMQQYGSDIPDALQPMIEKQALERAIYRRLFEQLLAEHRLEPNGKAASRVLAKAYKENFPNFLENGQFNFTKLDQFMRERGFTRTEFEHSVLADYALSQGQNLLQGIDFVSNPDKIARKRLSEMNISFKISVLDETDKTRLLKNEINITEAEIQARFAKDYLSLNKDDKLTKIKREAIEKSIINDKKGEIENKWLKELKDNAKSNPLAVFARSNGLTIYSWNNLDLTKTINEQKPDKAPDFSYLDSNSEFLNLIFKSEVGKTLGPIEEGEKLIFVEVSKRNIPELPPVSSIASGDQSLKTEASKVSENNESANSGNNSQFQSIFSIMMESYKNSIRIIRYNKEENQAG